ncbi:TetR/AcrR family transcriptional regulator [Kibdelosporangium lantanae]|uniref:TetR/AcrR family transcriptional regulator n=1 Tax=Kibdelosporangium lantanae TaxID=1497396 RepID=A0ABW3MK34_9PSEU
MDSDSPKLGRRERSKAATRQKLLTAALLAFSEKGYEAATIDEIAEAADVARATAFNYFPRKEDFVSGLLADRIVRIAAILREHHLDDPDGPFPEAMRALVRALARWYESEAKTSKVLIRSVLLTGSLLTPGYYTSAATYAKAVAAAQERGEVRSDVDASAVGSLLLDGYFGVLYRWCVDDGSVPDLESALVQTVDIILRGVA